MISRTVLDKLEFSKVLQYISNYCITEKGKKEVLSLYPIQSEDTIKNEGKLVSEAKEILIKDLPPPLEYIIDLNDALATSRVEGAILDNKKILEVLKLLTLSRNTYQYLKHQNEIAPGLFKITNTLLVDKLLEHAIQKVITENGEVKDSASPKLAEIRREIRQKNDELVKAVNRIMKSLEDKDIIREDYLTLRDGRVVIPVKVEHKRHIRGFIHSESSTGQTVYIEPEQTLELNNELVSLSFAEKREIEKLLKELTKRIGQSSSELKLALETLSYIDSIFARAKYSVEIIGSFPEIDSSKDFYLSDARHPILLKRNGKAKTVPLDVTIKDQKIILITGPNAGGKTVVLKTIGLLASMVNSGIHIPASPDSNFPLFTNVLLDIGDTQSIEDDLSTFSSHLSNIKNILDDADEKSLVLFDEIGTGTDPAEGSALAVAILLQLRDKNSIVFATTHHGSLKLVAHDLDGFENSAMEFDSKNLMPTYKFNQGVPGSSYAFEVAKRIGFDDNFLSLAEQYLDKDKHTLENFLVDIEKKSNELADKLRKMEIENTRLTGLSNLYQQNVEKLNKEKKEILRKTKTDAEEYLKDINKKFERVIKEVKESNANKEIIKSSQNTIKEIKEKNKNLFKDDVDLIQENPNFIIGDFVRVRNTETTGEIIDVLTDKNRATLRVGTLKLQVKLTELVHSKKKEAKVESGNFYNLSNDFQQMRIDIRGQRAEEAEFEIIKFIDNAYSNSLERIEILHGKGTGALKKTVSEILKKHDKVKNFYFAPIEFGGDGITIAELK